VSLAYLDRFWSPWRLGLSGWWAMLNQSDLAPVPVARDIHEAYALVAELNRNYRNNWWNGQLGVIEDPRRIEHHRQRGTLHLLSGLNCAGIAMYAYAVMRGLAPDSRNVVKLADATGQLSHAVCEFWLDGQHQALDTNGWHTLVSWSSLSARWQAIYPAARYEDEERLPYPFPDPGKV
jgi:hypothetical protein